MIDIDWDSIDEHMDQVNASLVKKYFANVLGKMPDQIIVVLMSWMVSHVPDEHEQKGTKCSCEDNWERKTCDVIAEAINEEYSARGP